MPFRDLVKFIYMAKRQGYYVARCAMIKKGYGLQEISLMLSYRLNQIAEEEKLANFQKQFTECKVYEFPKLISV